MAHGLASGEDLPQRFLRQVDRLADRFGTVETVTARTDLAELVYGGDIRTLNNAVADYVTREKEEVWLLLDNLDKSWVTRGTTREDMAILLGLLDASRSLERELDRRNVEFRSLVFIRTDILEHLNRETPDRGKETPISLDWDDVEVFREILRRRIQASTELEGDFLSLWGQVAEPTVKAQDSFGYMVDRTLMRPRDMLLFVQQAVEVATNRGHSRITAEDIQHAEGGYSEGALLWLTYEIEDTHPDVAAAIYSFHGAPPDLSGDEVRQRLVAAGIEPDKAQEALELLLLVWVSGDSAGRRLRRRVRVQSSVQLTQVAAPRRSGAG